MTILSVASMTVAPSVATSPVVTSAMRSPSITTVPPKWTVVLVVQGDDDAVAKDDAVAHRGLLRFVAARAVYSDTARVLRVVAALVAPTRQAGRPRRAAGRRTGAATSPRATTSPARFPRRRRPPRRGRERSPAARRRCRSGSAARRRAIATGTIAASDVACASSWPSPTTSVSVATNGIPPPMPNSADRMPASEAERLVSSSSVNGAAG